MGKETANHNGIYFGSATLLLTLGWLMRSFPLLIFVGIAPLIAIARNKRENKAPWSSIELIMLALSAGYFAGVFFEIGRLAGVILQAILISLGFLGFTSIRKTLGSRVNLLTLALFWLAIEYAFLKIMPNQFTYLADALALKPEWTQWNNRTGYLGATLWILFCNVLLYHAVLANKKVNWIYLILFMLFLVLPLAYSYTLSESGIQRNQMLSLYSGTEDGLPADYVNRGEFIARTSAWISVLILLFGLIKYNVNKK